MAVSLGAGGIGLAGAATSSGPLPIHREVSPGRLVDTRAEFRVGEIPGALTSPSTTRVEAADHPQLITSGQDINLVCSETDGDVRVVNAHVTAEFFPTSYSPADFTLPSIVGPISPRGQPIGPPADPTCE